MENRSMVRKFLAAICLLGALTETADARRVCPILCGAKSTFKAACSQSASFLARNGGAHAAATDALICGMVTTGIFAKLDAFYILATTTAANANLNVISTSFTLTPVNSPTFTVDLGYAGNGTSSYLDSGFNPSTAPSPNYAQNSASIFVRSNVNVGTNNSTMIGTVLTAGAAGLNPLNGDNATASTVLNDAAAQNNANSSATSKGLFVVSRIASNGYLLYREGVNVGGGAASSVSTAATHTMTIGSNASAGQFSSRQIAEAGFGAGMTATDALNLSTLIASYNAAVGVP